MTGLASDAPDWRALFPGGVHLFDANAWAFCCQAGWRSGAESVEADEAFESLLEEAVHSESCDDLHVIRPGRFSQLFPFLGLDEWTYLCGFPPQIDAKEIHAGISRAWWLDEEHADLIEAHGLLSVIHIDGWWEIYPSTHPLLSQIHIGGNLAKTSYAKWKAFNKDPMAPIAVDFRGVSCVSRN